MPWIGQQEICHEAGRKWAVKYIALAHRVGYCGMGQASVIVAVSSVYRKASTKVVLYEIMIVAPERH